MPDQDGIIVTTYHWLPFKHVPSFLRFGNQCHSPFLITYIEDHFNYLERKEYFLYKKKKNKNKKRKKKRVFLIRMGYGPYRKSTRTICRPFIDLNLINCDWSLLSAYN